MRLALDATSLLLRSAGVKNFVYHWIGHLRRTAGTNSLRVFPFLDRVGPLSHEASAVGWWDTQARLALIHFSNLPGNPVLSLACRGADVFHTSQHVVNPPRNALLTGTLYDMTCWLMPEMHTRGNVFATKLYGERLRRRAAGVIAISEHTRADAIRLLRFPPDRITSIYPGVEDRFFDVPAAHIERARSALGLSRPYVLFVSTIEPRKNIGTLLDAWRALPVSLREEFELVLAGPPGWDHSMVARLRTSAEPVRYLGYVLEDLLPGLTAGATVFVYPSFYEGFGFPVAQAMAAGTPVVTSDTSSLPEIAGDAALLVDPRSLAELGAAIEKLLLSPSLRDDLRTRGLARARQFTWETCARRSWEFFERLR
jgi:glycosyltransferase involved in cell wall biosynthesis